MKYLALGAIALSLVASTAPAASLQPVVISSNDPGALTAPDVKTDKDGSKFRRMGESVDKRLRSGLYSAAVEKATIASYPNDEFMYFLKGGVTLTSTDGTVVKSKPGDAVYLPKGWSGTWYSEGYTKFYVVYDSDKKAE